MERHFELELEKLNKRILKMGNLVYDQVHNALEALLTCNIELAQQVVELDNKVDKLDVKIDKLCQRIFALQQPVATDLRLIMSALKMNNDLERLGDLAVNISSKVEGVSEYGEILAELHIDELSNMADIEALCEVEDEGIEGVICGRAIYSGDLDFAAAQERADELNG